MNSTQIVEWCKALRSGDYDQAKEELVCTGYAGDRSYCCLGVYAEINNLWDGGRSDEEVGNHPHSRVESNAGNLPYDLLTKEDQDELVDMNDSQERSFFAIADWIEENVEAMKCPTT